MNKVDHITLIGKHSGKEFVIDLKAILDITEIFLADSPRERRDIATVTRIVHVNDTLTEALRSELEATKGLINSMELDADTMRALEESDG